MYLISLKWYFREKKTPFDCFSHIAQNWNDGTRRSGVPASGSATWRGCGGRGTVTLHLCLALGTKSVSSTEPNTQSILLADGLFLGQQHRQSRLVYPLVNAQEITGGILLELLASSADRQDICASLSTWLRAGPECLHLECGYRERNGTWHYISIFFWIHR